MGEGLLPAHVRVPASTSNLGAGFDLIGLALGVHLHARFTPGPEPLTLAREGTLADLPTDEPDLLTEAFRSVLRESGVTPRGTLHATSAIPVTRGLGSSAAAVLAGHDLGLAALGQPADPESAFLAAYEHEGHGDNAAPSAFGGLCAVTTSDDGPMVMELELSPEIGFAYAAPARGVSTKAARAALPDQLPHAVAVSALGRLAALMRGLAQGDPDLLRTGVDDALHVPYRLPLIPGGAAALAAGYDAGAWAVTISGAGSGLIALAPPSETTPIAEAMREELMRAADENTGGVALSLLPEYAGLTRVDP